jgi:cobalt/nickel transport system permease protein
LQVGAFCVTLETAVSGITELPFGLFVLAMQPIHLAIGLVEGIVTAVVLCYIHTVRPGLLVEALENRPETAIPSRFTLKKVIISIAILAVITAAGLSLFASAYPDGLEWSMERTAGTAELEREGAVYDAAAGVVEKTAFMPDYGFKSASPDGGGAAGTASAGLVGSLITVVFIAALGFAIYALRRKRKTA